MNAALVIAGFFVGCIVGLTGVGGAAIMTPLLVLAFKVDPLIAVGSDLVYSVPTRLYGAYLHSRQGTVNWKITGALLMGGIPAAIVGLVLLYWLRGHIDITLLNMWTRRAIGIALLMAAAIMLLRPFSRKSAAQRNDASSWNRLRRVYVTSIGAVVGLTVTVTSIGSGSVTLPLLVIILPFVALPDLIGSDIAFGAFLIPAAAFGRWTMGDVNLPLALNLMAGSLPGVYIGSKICRMMKVNWLRPVVAVTLAVIGTRMV